MVLALILVIGTLCLTLLGVVVAFSYRSWWDRESVSAFECGFDPYQSSRLPFSLQFFLVALIFLIFDVEIVLLLPFPISLDLNHPLTFYAGVVLFLAVLLCGTYYEWGSGALNWIF
uniref:NADH-ubiquinone oxidoreductase chain 3 n=1 Tax=Antrokoreana gracilipes TaxID=364406 RepID=A9X4I4_ANTGC|nr:NADH dehydrogenase subunit 3 [Antrokoreana gracilipes]ABC55884.1 NADH dehydrogenase subunit 3 [Antrokoreana gracilipes]